MPGAPRGVGQASHKPQPQRPTTAEALEWQMNALCRQVSPDLFFPDDKGGRNSHDAKQICRMCSVTTPCLQYALRYDEAGVWGGMTEKERRALKRETPAPATGEQSWLDRYSELKALGYNDVHTARRMGISTRSLCRQLSRYGLKPDAVAQEELADFKRQKRQGVA